MSDRSASADPALAEFVEIVVHQVPAAADLDAARAEAWASDVLALIEEHDVDPVAFGEALARMGDDRAATALAALAGFTDGLPAPEWRGDVPVWTGAIGTSTCEGAWVLSARDSVSIAFRFVDVLDERHVLTVDLLAGEEETVGEVVVGPGDLLDALSEDDAAIDRAEGGPVELAARCVAALRRTTHPSMSLVVNGRLLLRRLATLVVVDVPPPVAVPEVIPDPPPRDADDDAYALDVLDRALPDSAGPVDHADAPAVTAVAGLVAPEDLAPLDPPQRDAVLLLEWADWLGAVIGLVRAGEGCIVDGEVMVDLVNRCPEVTTTIPKADRDRIRWAFDTLIEPWPTLGIVDAGRLTEQGRRVLPAALRLAWGRPLSR